MVKHGREEHRLLGFIDGHDACENSEFHPGFEATLVQRLNIFGEATSTISDAREEKARADSTVGSHAFADHVHIGSYALAEIGHLVHEGDFGGQK